MHHDSIERSKMMEETIASEKTNDQIAEEKRRKNWVHSDRTETNHSMSVSKPVCLQ